MVIFHRASVCPDHFPFNESLGLFLLDLNSEPSDPDCRRILIFFVLLNIFVSFRDITKLSFTKKDRVFLYSFQCRLRFQNILSNRSSKRLLENSFQDY